jgi:hypothetical protein
MASSPSRCPPHVLSSALSTGHCAVPRNGPNSFGFFARVDMRTWSGRGGSNPSVAVARRSKGVSRRSGTLNPTLIKRPQNQSKPHVSYSRLMKAKQRSGNSCVWPPTSAAFHAGSRGSGSSGLAWHIMRPGPSRYRESQFDNRPVWPANLYDHDIRARCSWGSEGKREGPSGPGQPMTEHHRCEVRLRLGRRCFA